MTSQGSKFWSAVSGLISGIFLIDMVAWLVSGEGLAELVGGGSDSPLVISIAERVTTIPDWAFYLVCVLAIIGLSAIMTISITASKKTWRH